MKKKFLLISLISFLAVCCMAFGVYSMNENTKLNINATLDFVPHVYNITYDLDGGAWDGTPGDSTYNTLENYILKTNVKKTGYQFIGWTGNNVTTPTTNLTITAGTKGDLSFLANWDALQYELVFDANGGTIPPAPNGEWTGSGATATKPLVYDAPYGTLPTPTRDGYTFAGWEGVNAEDIVKVTSGFETKAQWTANSYQLTYISNGGTTVSAKNKTYDTAFTAEDLPEIEKAGYIFEGWYNNESFTTKINSGDAFNKNTATFAGIATAGTVANVYAKFIQAEARIGNVYYRTLAEAFVDANASSSAVTIHIIKNVQLASGITVDNASNKAITLSTDGNYTISRADGQTFVMFSVASGDELIISGGSSTLTISGAEQTALSTKNYIVNTAGTLRVQANTVITENKTTAINVAGQFFLESGTLTANSSTTAGAVNIAESGSMTMSGGTISGNIASTQGGAIWNAGTFTMTAGRISGNMLNNSTTSSRLGSAIYTTGNLDLNGGEISGHNIDGYTANNGTIYVNDTDVILNVDGGTVISNNKTSNGGGAIYLNGGTLNVKRGTISENSSNDGGAVFAANATINVSGSEILVNSASNCGGAFSITNTSTFAMTGGIVSGNSVDGEGAAVYIIDDSTGVISGTAQFLSNTAGYSGGAITAYGSSLQIVYGTFRNNSASIGGVISASCPLNISGGMYENNNASLGGVVACISNSASISYGMFNTNTSTSNGSFYYGRKASLTITNAEINANEGSSTFYNDGGTINIIGEAFNESWDSTSTLIENTGTVNLSGNPTLNGNVDYLKASESAKLIINGALSTTDISLKYNSTVTDGMEFVSFADGLASGINATSYLSKFNYEGDASLLYADTTNNTINYGSAKTVTIDTNGGTVITANGWTGTTTLTKTAYYGKTLGALPVLEKAYYTFVSYNDKDNDSVVYTSDTVVTGNHSIVAKWQENVITGGGVTISGTARYGETLTATASQSTPNATISYQWYYDNNNDKTGGVAISGATSSTYTIGLTNNNSTLVGKYIYVVITYTKDNYRTLTVNAVTSAVASRQITVSGNTASKIYDGTALTGTASLTNGTLASGDEGTYTANGNITDVGTTPNVPTAVIKKGSVDVSDSYAITLVNGTLTITRKQIAVPTANNKTYNGLTQTGVNAGTGYTLSGTTSAIDAGNYTVTATLTDNYTWSDGTGEKTITWTISPKPVEVSWGSETSFVYDGTEKKPTASATSGVTNETINLTVTGAINVGNYTATASISSVTGGRANTSNYTLTGTTKAFTITNATMTVSATGYTGTYDGKAHSITVTVSKPTSGYTIYYSTSQLTASNYSSASTTNISQTNVTAGVTVYYYVVADNYTPASGSANIVINKASLTVTANDHSLAYGTDTATSNNGVTYNGFVNGETASDLGGALTYTVNGTVHRPAGTYTITPSGLTSNNYTIRFETGTLTINQTSSSLSTVPTSLSIVYGKTDTFTYTYTGDGQVSITSNDTTVASVSHSGNTVTVTANKVGSTSITVSASATANFASASATVSVTVTKSMVTLTAVSSTVTKTYDGTMAASVTKDTNYTVTATGAVPSASILSVSAVYASANAGNPNVTITGTLSDTTNFGFDQNSCTVNGKINQRAVTVTANDQTIVYGSLIATGTSQATLSSQVDGHTLSAVTLTPSTSNVTTSGKITPSGATIESGSTDVTSNYAISYVDGNLTITKANISPTVSMSGYTYGGTKSTPTVNGNTGNGSVTYYYNTSNSNSGGTAWTNVTSSTSLNAGEYYMYAEVAETTSYKGATTNPVAFTISKANGSISFANTTVTKTYGDANFTNAVTKTGDGTVTYASNNTTVATVSSTGLVTIKAAGNATITASVSDGTNYTYPVKNTSFNLVVNKKDLELPVITISSNGVVSWTAVANANSYEIKTNNTEYTSVSGTSIDYKEEILNALDGGTGIVTVNVKANPSNANYSAVEGSATINIRAVLINKTAGIDSVTVSGGSASNVFIVGSTVSLTATVQTGYEFYGWSGYTTGSNQTISFTMPDSYPEIIASARLIEYVIIYNLDGGTVDTENPETYNILSDPINLNNPTKEGYNFVGWSGTGIVGIFDDVSISSGSTGNREYTAHWSEILYTITLDARQSKYNLESEIYSGWSRSSGSNVTYTRSFRMGETLQLPHLSRVDYAFNGWYTASSGGTQVDSSTVVTANATYYAQWTKLTAGSYITIHYCSNPDNSNLTLYGETYIFRQSGLELTVPGSDYFNFNGPEGQGFTSFNFYSYYGSGSWVSSLASLGGNYWLGSPDKTPSGYSNGNYRLYEGMNNGAYIYTKPYIFAANWQELTPITVTFNANGGSVSPTSRDYYTGVYYTNLPTPTRSGYDFIGWFTASTGGTQVTEETRVTATADHTIYAQWAKQVTLVLNGNTGEIKSSSNWTGSGTSVTKIVSTIGTVGYLPSTSQVEFSGEYILDGWWTASSGGTEVESTTNVADIWNGSSDTITIYAHKTNQVKVTLDANGGNFSSNSNYAMYGWTKEGYLENRATKTLTLGVRYSGDKSSLPTPKRDGYTFYGWYSRPSGGTKIDASTIFTKISPTRLYAVWEDPGSGGGGSTGGSIEVNLYARDYEGNYSGTFSNLPSGWFVSEGIAYHSPKFSEGDTLGTLPTVTCSDSTMTFIGWYTASGTEVTSSTVVTASASYYAKFGPITITITLSYLPANNSAENITGSINSFTDGWTEDSFGFAEKSFKYGDVVGELISADANDVNYYLEGWYTLDGSEKLTSETIVTVSKAYYARYTLKQYDVTLIVNSTYRVPLIDESWNSWTDNSGTTWYKRYIAFDELIDLPICYDAGTGAQTTKWGGGIGIYNGKYSCEGYTDVYLTPVWD